MQRKVRIQTLQNLVKINSIILGKALDLFVNPLSKLIVY